MSVLATVLRKTQRADPKQKVWRWGLLSGKKLNTPPFFFLFQQLTILKFLLSSKNIEIPI